MKSVETQEALARVTAGTSSAVLFTANWCPFCRTFAPVFADVMAGQTDVTTVEVNLNDEGNPLWDVYRIDVVPTVLFFAAGEVTHRLDGRRGVGLARADLRDALQRVRQETGTI